VSTIDTLNIYTYETTAFDRKYNVFLFDCYKLLDKLALLVLISCIAILSELVR